MRYPALPPDTRVVATCGISGSGKTTYAKTLESVGFRRLSLDRIAWENRPQDLDNLSLEERREFFGACSRNMMSELDALLAVGERVVVDATMCKRAGRDALRDVCRRHGLEPLLVYFPVDRATLAARLSCRTGAGPDDQRVSESDLASFCQGFQPPAPDEAALQV